MAQAVQGVPLRVWLLQRFLVAFDSSSSKGDVPSADAPGAIRLCAIRILKPLQIDLQRP